jgi:hypothetical protein
MFQQWLHIHSRLIYLLYSLYWSLADSEGAWPVRYVSSAHLIGLHFFVLLTLGIHGARGTFSLSQDAHEAVLNQASLVKAIDLYAGCSNVNGARLSLQQIFARIPLGTVRGWVKQQRREHGGRVGRRWGTGDQLGVCARRGE